MPERKWPIQPTWVHHPQRHLTYRLGVVRALAKSIYVERVRRREYYGSYQRCFWNFTYLQRVWRRLSQRVKRPIKDLPGLFDCNCPPWCHLSHTNRRLIAFVRLQEADTEEEKLAAALEYQESLQYEKKRRT